MEAINKENRIKKIFSILICSAILIFSVGGSVSANTGHDTFIDNNKVESIISKDGTSITLKANDKNIKFDLMQKIDEVTNGRNQVRGCITVVDIENNQVIGSARFNK